jgi:hypothetical protein
MIEYYWRGQEKFGYSRGFQLRSLFTQARPVLSKPSIAKDCHPALVLVCQNLYYTTSEHRHLVTGPADSIAVFYTKVNTAYKGRCTGSRTARGGLAATTERWPMAGARQRLGHLNGARALAAKLLSMIA